MDAHTITDFLRSCSLSRVRERARERAARSAVTARSGGRVVRSDFLISPVGEVLFFACAPKSRRLEAKKSTQKKSHPEGRSARCRGGRSHSTSLCDVAPHPNPLPASGERESGLLSFFVIPAQAVIHAERRCRAVAFDVGPLCVAPRSTATKGSSGRVSERCAASRVSAAPFVASTTGYRRAAATQSQGVLSLAYFSLHKQREVSRRKAKSESSIERNTFKRAEVA